MMWIFSRAPAKARCSSRRGRVGAARLGADRSRRVFNGFEVGRAAALIAIHVAIGVSGILVLRRVPARPVRGLPRGVTQSQPTSDRFRLTHAELAHDGRIELRANPVVRVGVVHPVAYVTRSQEPTAALEGRERQRVREPAATSRSRARRGPRCCSRERHRYSRARATLRHRAAAR